MGGGSGRFVQYSDLSITPPGYKCKNVIKICGVLVSFLALYSGVMGQIQGLQICFQNALSPYDVRCQ